MARKAQAAQMADQLNFKQITRADLKNSRFVKSPNLRRYLGPSASWHLSICGEKNSGRGDSHVSGSTGRGEFFRAGINDWNLLIVTRFVLEPPWRPITEGITFTS